MKKLMIAAAIVCAAAMAQAAKVNWSVSGLDSGVSGTVYTFCAQGDNKVSRKTLLAALEACTTAADFNTAFAGYSGKAISSLSGEIETAGTFTALGVDMKTAGIPETTKNVTFYSVILSDETMTDSSTWWITESAPTQTSPAYNTDTTATFAVLTGATAHTFTAPAPEPTSGLLLLLGVAGLALKRRRA